MSGISNFTPESEAEYRRREQEKAAAWLKAVERLQVEFEATHGGGYPDCLKDMDPEQRLQTLRRLGFRVREQFTISTGALGAPKLESCAYLYGRIFVNLADGWVNEELSK